MKVLLSFTGFKTKTRYQDAAGIRCAAKKLKKN